MQGYSKRYGIDAKNGPRKKNSRTQLKDCLELQTSASNRMERCGRDRR